jgi:CheY-like chemotaxis protein
MSKLKKIMLIEDDEIDVMTVKRALKELNVENPLVVASNGEEALKMLQEYSYKPFIIILDLNMPRMNGLEFLKIIKNDEDFKKIPAVVLTTSKEEQDIFESYKLGVAGYIIKPVDYSKFVDALRTLNLYWNLCNVPE